MAEVKDCEAQGADTTSAEAVTGETSGSTGAETTADPANTKRRNSGASDRSEGEVEDNAADNAETTQEEQQQQPGLHPNFKQEDLDRYKWCKCSVDPSQYNGVDCYFLQMETQQSMWQEPGEPYWLWDASTQTLHESGLHHPAMTSAPARPDEPDPDYQGYNPKIHGSYDPTAPYAQYHNRKRAEEEYVAPAPGMAAAQGGYEVAGAFNRFTGSWQGGEQSTERHTDQAKSSRQMGAFFDVDAAANSHHGRSLKEERRNEKLSKKQIKEMTQKRKAKKEKKRMDFYKS